MRRCRRRLQQVGVGVGVFTLHKHARALPYGDTRAPSRRPSVLTILLQVPPYLPSCLTGPSSSSAPAAAAAASDPTPYFVVGTAFVRAEESEPSKGRLLVLQVSGGWQGVGGTGSAGMQVEEKGGEGSEENEPS